VYLKYYAPKQPKQPIEPKTPASSTDSAVAPMQTPASSHRQSGRKVQSVPSKASKQDFFTPRAISSKKAAPDTKNGIIKDSQIDEKIFYQHIEALETCLTDFLRLKEMGLVRTFVDEVECGKTVGSTNGPLTAPERQQVLSMLGGNKSGKSQSKQRRPSMIESRSSQDSAASSASSLNEIWDQMCRQTSISAQFTNTSYAGTQQSSDSKGVLPVSPHVNNLVFDKLAARIVQASSISDYVAVQVMHAQKCIIKECIARVLKSLTSNGQPLKTLLSAKQLDSILGKVGTCIKLREKPHQALLRVCRVFLCATGGPGQMRSDGGTNGWKSILELDPNIILENTKFKDVPHVRNVEPPGVHSWHSVTYPGLHHRFGLATFSFREAYQQLPITSVEALDSAAIQIFGDSQAFRCWESSAEFRCEMLLYCLPVFTLCKWP
jgi:hypothetical protein